MSMIGGGFTRVRIGGMFAGAALALVAFVPGALAQGAQRVNVYDYAVEHPVPDVQMAPAPTLGASVPQSVQLATVDDDKVYGYFYYAGRPVIVEMATRAVVRVDQ